MAQTKQYPEADERGVECLKWNQRYKELGDAILKAKMDASNLELLFDDERIVKHHLDQASKHLDSASNEPAKRERNIQAGFAEVGMARAILARSPVQSGSFRRHQWPFLPPGGD